MISTEAPRTSGRDLMDNAPLTRLTYVSRHDLICDADGFNPAFAAIETAAMPANADLAVTGFLVCTRSWFAQVIEGPAGNIERLYAAIERDRRHRDPQVIEHAIAERRLFPDWHMAMGIASPASSMVFATLDFSEMETPRGRAPRDFHDLATDLAALKRLSE